jgi:ribosome-associated translation inhibitor RaiA
MKRFERRSPSPFNFTDQDVAMAVPVDIQFRHMHESKRVQEQVEQLMGRFDKYTLPGAKMSVVIDQTHQRMGKSVFQVKAKLTVLGERLYVAHSMEQPGWEDGVFSALSTVFDSVEHQLVRRHGKQNKRRHVNAYDKVA